MDGIKPSNFKPLLSSIDSGAQPAAKLPETKDPVKASEQFEALLLQDLLKSMWKTVPKSGMLSGSDEEETYRDMLNEALAKSVSEGRGIGVKDVILKDINKLEKKSA